jgi:hypothetical protein
MGYLAACVHPRIRAAGALHRHRHAVQMPEDTLQLTLHRAQSGSLRLRGPAMEVTTVVGDVEAQTKQPVTGGSGDGLSR